MKSLLHTFMRGARTWASFESVPGKTCVLGQTRSFRSESHPWCSKWWRHRLPVIHLPFESASFPRQQAARAPWPTRHFNRQPLAAKGALEFRHQTWILPFVACNANTMQHLQALRRFQNPTGHSFKSRQWIISSNRLVEDWSSSLASSPPSSIGCGT